VGVILFPHAHDPPSISLIKWHAQKQTWRRFLRDSSAYLYEQNIAHCTIRPYSWFVS